MKTNNVTSILPTLFKEILSLPQKVETDLKSLYEKFQSEVIKPDSFSQARALAKPLYRQGKWVEASKIFEGINDYNRAMYCLHRALEEKDGPKSENYNKIFELYAKSGNTLRAMNYAKYADYQLAREFRRHARSLYAQQRAFEKQNQKKVENVAVKETPAETFETLKTKKSTKPSVPAITHAPVDEVPSATPKAEKVPVKITKTVPAERTEPSAAKKIKPVVAEKEEPKKAESVSIEITGTLAEFPEYVPFVKFLSKIDSKWLDTEFVNKQVEIANTATSGPVKQMYFGQFCYDYLKEKYGSKELWAKQLNNPSYYYQLAERLRPEGAPLSLDPNDVEKKLASLTAETKKTVKISGPKKIRDSKTQHAVIEMYRPVGLGRKKERSLVRTESRDISAEDGAEASDGAQFLTVSGIKNEIKELERRIKNGIAFISDRQNTERFQLAQTFQETRSLMKEWKGNKESISQYDKAAKRKFEQFAKQLVEVYDRRR